MFRLVVFRLQIQIVSLVGVLITKRTSIGTFSFGF